MAFNSKTPIKVTVTLGGARQNRITNFYSLEQLKNKHLIFLFFSFFYFGFFLSSALPLTFRTSETMKPVAQQVRSNPQKPTKVR